MNEEDIKNQISDVVADSPVTTKKKAQEDIEAPKGYSTLRADLPENMPEAPAQQFETTPTQGIQFGIDTDEMITTGTAFPGKTYDTQFQTETTGGDPLYYEPNFQPVEPYPVGNIKTDTINPNKMEWAAARSLYGARDENYIGYYLLPEQGSLSWWDFFVGNSLKDIGMLIPRVGQGITNMLISGAKIPMLAAQSVDEGGNYFYKKLVEQQPENQKLKTILESAGIKNPQWTDVINKIRLVAPDSDTGSLYNEILKEPTEMATKMLNQMQDWVDGAVNSLDKSLMETWDADLTDQSFKAKSARAISSGAVNLGAAILSQNPELFFTFLNFAGAGDMRRNALNYGMSPLWSEVYSIGGSGINSVLDILQFDALVNSGSLLKQGSAELLKHWGESGLLKKGFKGLGKSIVRHAPREIAATAGEISTEMLQTAIEGAYDPEVLEHPYEPLLLAGLSAAVLKIGMLPVSVRNANIQEMSAIAEKAGVAELFKSATESLNAVLDTAVEIGMIDPAQREEIFKDALKHGPDYILKTLREGTKGQFDKVPLEQRQNFIKLVNDIKNNYEGDVFSPQTIAKLDSEVETNLSGIRNGLSDAEVDMIKGIVRGAYVVSAIANANNPNYKGFQVPTFNVSKSGATSGYSYSSNTITISGTRSDTEYSNNSPEFAELVRRGFLPSSSESDKMASLLHELTHWMDAMVGQKGFGDFLEYYYNGIAEVFGKDKALSVYKASQKGNKRMPKVGKVEYTSEQNATEYAAQAVSRLGKRAAETFGLGKSKANEFLSYANMMLNQLANLEGANGQKLQQSIANFQTALQEITKANMQHLEDLIEVYGSDKLQNALARFKDDAHGFDDFAEYLANEDMLRELYDVMDSFSDAAGLDKIKDLFGGDTKAMDNFVTAGDRMFRNGYDQAVAEVKQRRAEAKATKKPVEAKADPSIVKTPAGAVDTNLVDLKKYLLGPDLEQDGDTVAERAAYASMRNPLEGETLDVDAHYAEGEALGRLGSGMAHGYGNNVLFSLESDKEFYYDQWKKEANEGRQLEFVGNTGDSLQQSSTQYPRVSDVVMSYINATPTGEDPNTLTKGEYITGLDTAIKDLSNSIEEARKEHDIERERLLQEFGIYKLVLDGNSLNTLEFMSTRDFNNMLSLKDGLEMFQDAYSPKIKNSDDFEAMHTVLRQYVRSATSIETLTDLKNGVEEHKTAFEEDYKDKSNDAVIAEMRTFGSPELHEFMVPDAEYMLNEEKTLAEQSPFVKDAIAQMAIENPNIPLLGGKESLGELQTLNSGEPQDESLALLDGESFRRMLNDYYMNDEAGKKERVRFFEDKIKNKKYLDGATKTDAYRTVSLLLNKYGIQGIEFNGKHDGHGAVVFNGNVQHSRRVYETGGTGEMQGWALQALGAKESVKRSHDAVTEEPLKIFADREIDGRVLSDDIKLAQGGLATRLKNKMNPIVKWAASSEWGWGLDRILVTLLGRPAAEKFDIQGKYSAKQAARSKYWGEFMDRLKPLFGDNVDKAGFVYKYKTMVTDLGIARMTNVEMIDPRNTELSTTRDITGWDAMYVYLMQRQGYGARVQKSTTTNINDIVNLLSPEEKQFADAMSAQLMSMYEKTFGKQSYTNYFPIMDLEHKLFNEVSIDSLMSRMNTDDAISIEDAGRIFSQYVSRWASHESGYFQEIKRLRDVFMYKGVDASETGPRYTFDPDADVELIKQSASVANATINAIGQKGYDNLMNLINTQLSDGQEEIFETTRSNALNQMGNNVMKTLLANKLISFPKNLTNMFMMWGGAQDQSIYWNSFAEGFGDMKKTFDYMMAHSDEIKRRWGSAGGINEYLDQNSLGGNTAPIMKAISKAFRTMEWSADRTQNMAKFSAAMDMMGDAGLKLFMQSGDMVANVYGGYGLVKDYMAQGMTEAEAFKKLDRYIVEHQSSSNLAMKPMIQLRANKGFFSQFFAFTSEQVVKAASVLGTFDEVKMGTATKSQAIGNLVSIAISATLFSALAAGAWDLWDDDEKVREEAEKAIVYAAIDQALGGFVAGNSILTPALSALIGDSRMGGMRNPLYEYAMDGITALKKEEYDRLVTKAMSALGVFVGADNAWNSMLGLSLLTDPDPRVREAGVLMTVGYSPSRAKKRTGVDTRKEILENVTEE